MTVGWIREGDLERILAATESLPAPQPELLVERKRCPFCASFFANLRQLGEHLAVSHLGSRPFLLVNGHEPVGQSTFNEPIAQDRISLSSFTGIAVRLDGGGWADVGEAEFAEVLSSARYARVRVRLTNRFEAKALPLVTEYDFDFRVADEHDLVRVDRLFIERLGRPAPTVSDIDAFLQAAGDGAFADYARGLATYVLAVLMKDGAPKTGIRPAGGEYRATSNDALRTLRRFDRPLPRLLCSLLRFSANDFSYPDDTIGFDPLRRAMSLFARLTGELPEAAEGAAMEAPGGNTIPVCPIDVGTDAVLRRVDQLASLPRWTDSIEDQLRIESDLASLDPLDRVKLLAVWAETALRLGNMPAAEEPLRRLHGNDCFGSWAEARMKECGL